MFTNILWDDWFVHRFSETEKFICIYYLDPSRFQLLAHAVIEHFPFMLDFPYSLEGSYNVLLAKHDRYSHFDYSAIFPRVNYSRTTKLNNKPDHGSRHQRRCHFVLCRRFQRRVLYSQFTRFIFFSLTKGPELISMSNHFKTYHEKRIQQLCSIVTLADISRKLKDLATSQLSVRNGYPVFPLTL